VTHINLAIIKAGQIRGRLVQDINADGVAGKDEPGIEGAELLLMPGERKAFSAAFGQYAFDHLLPGVYTLTVPDTTVSPITIDVGYKTSLLQQQDIALPVNVRNKTAPESTRSRDKESTQDDVIKTKDADELSRQLTPATPLTVQVNRGREKN